MLVGRDLPEPPLASEFVIFWLDILWLFCTSLLPAAMLAWMTPRFVDGKCR